MARYHLRLVVLVEEPHVGQDVAGKLLADGLAFLALLFSDPEGLYSL